MAISEFILPEFDHEMANTRKTLQRLPNDKFDWRPHEKSYTLQALTCHLANVPSWTAMTLTQDSFDVAPEGTEPFATPQASCTDDLLKIFDKNVAEARAAIASVSDEELQKPWTLLQGGKEVFTMPRMAVLRLFILSHNIHHRAQLGVYLRLNDVPVPAIYGPSADEEGM